MSEVRRLLIRAQPGRRSAVRTHIRRGEHLVALIADRWPRVRRPQQWQVKHCRWALEHGLGDRAPSTRYDYWRSLRVLIDVLGRLQDWQPYLRGPWQHPRGNTAPQRASGGRPPKLPH